MIKKVDIKRVQSVLLNMGIKIAEIFDKHSIPYMLAYGTLLGAVRHKGFIPWDDDFDLYLFDDTYDEAITHLRNELPADMFVEDETSEPLYFHSWVHIKDIYSETHCELFPQDSLYSHKGISIDLYRTKRMPERELEKYLNDENSNYIKRRLSKGLIDQKEYALRMKKLQENITRTQNNPKGSSRDVYNLVPVYKCHLMYPDDVFPLKKYEFEGKSFLGPNNASAILTGIYGDYMKLPPEKKRTCHYSSVCFFERPTDRADSKE